MMNSKSGFGFSLDGSATASSTLAQRLIKVESDAVSAMIKGWKPIFIRHAEGAVLEDVDGNRFIDCTSGFGVAGIGHAAPAVLAAITSQASSVLHSMATLYPTASYVEALSAVASSVGRTSSPQVVLTGSGSESIEVALKLVSQSAEKRGILAFHGSYHGQSLGTIPLLGHRELATRLSGENPRQVTFIRYPNEYRPRLANHPELELAIALDEVEHQIAGTPVGGLPIGAIFVEPMQNPAGYIVPPNGFIKGLGLLCKKYNVLLVADEIFTGFGRCGEWLLFDHDETVADIVCVGKCMTGGLPAGACVADKSLMSKLATPNLVPLHGGTFMGNPIVCASIAATIETLQQQDLINRARNVGKRLLTGIRAATIDNRHVGDIRGTGAAIGIEFVIDFVSKAHAPTLAFAFANFLRSRGIIVLVSGLPHANVVTFAPPFVVSDDQLEVIIDAVAAATNACLT